MPRLHAQESGSVCYERNFSCKAAGGARAARRALRSARHRGGRSAGRACRASARRAWRGRAAAARAALASIAAWAALASAASLAADSAYSAAARSIASRVCSSCSASACAGGAGGPHQGLCPIRVPRPGGARCYTQQVATRTLRLRLRGSASDRTRTAPDRTPQPCALPYTLPLNPPSQGPVGVRALAAAHAQRTLHPLSPVPEKDAPPSSAHAAVVGLAPLRRSARLQPCALGRGVFARVLRRTGAPAPCGRVAPAALLALTAGGRLRSRRGRAALRRRLALRAARRRIEARGSGSRGRALHA